MRALLYAALLPSPAVLAAESAPACPAHTPPEQVRVRYVHDGDTVHLEDGRKVRLIGINSPEVARDGKPAETFAAEARNTLRALLDAHGNSAGLVAGEEEKDRYGRTLAHLFSPAGVNLQAAMLERGLAVAVAFPPNTRYYACYREAERRARCDAAGLWATGTYRPLPASRLDDDASGFRIVTGKVDRAWKTGKGIWLMVEGSLKIGIRKENLDGFDTDALLALSGREITLRGWLNPRAGSGREDGVRHYMRIRHPSAIEESLVCD